MLVSRHLSRALGKKIASRVRLSPVVMESTHDLDFVMWLLEPAKPDPRLFAGRLRLHGADQRLARCHVHHRDDGQRRGGDDRRRLEFPGELSELLLDLDRDHRHRRRAGARRHPARQLAQHRKDRPGVSDVDHAGRAGRSCIRRRHGAGDDPFPRSVHPEQAGDGDARERARGDGNLHGGRSVRRPRRAGEPAADERNDRCGRRLQGEIQEGRQPRSNRRPPHEDASRGHRARDHRRRPRRAVPRRGRQPPSGGEMDRPGREKSEPRGRSGAEDRRRFRDAKPRRIAQAPGSDRRHHRHRRTSARRSDHGGDRARHSAADREAARDRSRAVGARAEGDQGRQDRRRGRLHAALPAQVARRQGEGAHGRAGRRDAGDLARVHEPPGRDRQLQAHGRSEIDLARW